MQPSRIALAAAVATVVLGAGVPPARADAVSAADAVVVTRRVPLASADFATPASVERLYARLATAARRVCVSSVAPQTHSPACADRALEAAVAAVGDERLAAVHRERRGG